MGLWQNGDETVLVSPNNLLRFWIFIYRVSPLTYFINGIVSAGLANAHVTCSAVETLSIPPPADFIGICGQYLAPYIASAGGYMANPEVNAGSAGLGGLRGGAAACLYCPVSDVNAVLQQLGIDMDTGHAWRDTGFLVAYIVFNALAVFGVY
ncbi:uncharacterized protein B0T15DRAFT_572038 [Chaetomium strumarium]|uniref:Uncharacterized protein n=1 Tax=Chaetomium strumarium TaxID=1170767 RepID=A0AAJ0M7G4_9PEZI|nr:hypothetical protein B0T15DRAFT_572038 [Chaetomium strumarium]